MRYKKPFKELGFTTKCAIVESKSPPTDDAEFKEFERQSANRSKRNAKKRKKILAGILKLREETKR